MTLQLWGLLCRAEPQDLSEIGCCQSLRSICSWDAECQIAPARSILQRLESVCPTLPAVSALEKYSDLSSFALLNSFPFFPLRS